jgi:hypothetical protein
VFDRCSQEEPPLADAKKGHFVACWKYDPAENHSPEG